MTAAGANYLWQQIADVDGRPRRDDASATPVESGAANHDIDQLRFTLQRLAREWLEAEDDRHNRRPTPDPVLGSSDWWCSRHERTIPVMP